jgi:hypothetical protein
MEKANEFLRLQVEALQRENKKLNEKLEQSKALLTEVLIILKEENNENRLETISQIDTPSIG